MEKSSFYPDAQRLATNVVLNAIRLTKEQAQFSDEAIQAVNQIQEILLRNVFEINSKNNLEPARPQIRTQDFYDELLAKDTTIIERKDQL